MYKPCNECPYRRASAPGYLGESSWEPEEFLKQLNLLFGHPCHKAVDWDDKEDLEMNINDAPACVGMVQFAKNTCKMFDYPLLEAMRKRMNIDTKTVFATRKEFIDHHTKMK